MRTIVTYRGEFYVLSNNGEKMRLADPRADVYWVRASGYKIVFIPQSKIPADAEREVVSLWSEACDRFWKRQTLYIEEGRMPIIMTVGESHRQYDISARNGSRFRPRKPGKLFSNKVK